MTVEKSLKYRLYELTSGLWSLFSNEDQKMNKANNLSSTSLKRWTDTINFTNQPNLRMASVQGEVERRSDLAGNFWWLSLLCSASWSTVVFDRYCSSPKDYNRMWHTKNYNNLQDMIHLTPELKFIQQCSQQNWVHPFLLFNNSPTSGQNAVIQCENDADTSIVKVRLIDETDDPFEVSIYFNVTKFSGILNLAILAIFAFPTKFSVPQSCKI